MREKCAFPSGNSATRGRRGDMGARNKIEFRKGGGKGGRVKETMLLLPVYPSLSLSLVFLFLGSRNIRPNEIRFRGKSACPKSIATTSHYKGRHGKWL